VIETIVSAVIPVESIVTGDKNFMSKIKDKSEQPFFIKASCYVHEIQ
jgi:hypothetical protein